MSITDELRDYMRNYPYDARYSSMSSALKASIYALKSSIACIADRIDREHEECEGFCRRLEDAASKGEEVTLFGMDYVALPLDADGEPIHIGELVDEMLPFGGYAAPAPVDTMELSRGASGYGWMVKLDAENRSFISPKLLRHHHEPTVEDVLREFAQKMNENIGMYMGEAIDADEWRDADAKNIAEYAAKLRLAGEE